MATYKSDAGAILQPGNQINGLSSFNHEGVFGWPGIEAFEQVGFVKVTNVAADKASFKSFNITVPSPDRRVGSPIGRPDNRSLGKHLGRQAISSRSNCVQGCDRARTSWQLPCTDLGGG